MTSPESGRWRALAWRA